MSPLKLIWFDLILLSDKKKSLLIRPETVKDVEINTNQKYFIF